MFRTRPRAALLCRHRPENPACCETQKGVVMNVSSTVSGALTSAIDSGGTVHQVAAMAAFKSSLQQQASLLQLFDPAKAVPPPSSGRGQNVDVSV